MQVILTEEEYLKLKHQHDEQKRTYVKRIDVEMAFREMIEELVGDRKNAHYDPLTFQPIVNTQRLQNIMSRFWEKVDTK